MMMIMMIMMMMMIYDDDDGGGLSMVGELTLESGHTQATASCSIVLRNWGRC